MKLKWRVECEGLEGRMDKNLFGIFFILSLLEIIGIAINFPTYINQSQKYKLAIDSSNLRSKVEGRNRSPNRS